MSDKYLIIRLDNNKVELTGNISLAYDKTNLPKHAFNFKTERQLFWKVEEKYYDSISETLTVNVIDYNLYNGSLFEHEPKYSIKKLNFEKLDWQKFEPLIYSYTLNQLKGIIFNYRERFLDFTDPKREDVKSVRQKAPNVFVNKLLEKKELEVKVKYEDAKFDTSKIVFSIRLKAYKFVRQLEIVNPNLRKEFEYIKSYFVKRLGKSFLVKVKFVLLDNQVEEIVAESDDINNINGEVIKSIKVSSILNLQHFKSESEDRILYDAKRLSDEAVKLPLLEPSINEILEIFIANGNVRNIRQLEYLARDKQSLNERVQFTVKPLFGFVFHMIGDKQYFIWELLNSHATYVWKSNRAEDKIDLGEIVEQAITTIKNEGREMYKKYYKTIENPSYNFSVIEHSSSSLTEDERFSDWKKRLERFCS